MGDEDCERWDRREDVMNEFGARDCKKCEGNDKPNECVCCGRVGGLVMVFGLPELGANCTADPRSSG